MNIKEAARLIQQHNISQTEVAEVLTMDHSNLSRYLSENLKCSEKTELRICEVVLKVVRANLECRDLRKKIFAGKA